MEGSKSEEIFESFNLNPQLLLNEVLNIVDDLVDKSFTYFQGEASSLLKTAGTDREDELIKGMSLIRNMIQSTVDERMQKWEEYCLRHCFQVPEGFSLPESEESAGDDLQNLDFFTDKEIDIELNTLRDKITLVGKESAEISRELCALERQSSANNHFVASVDEIFELYNKLGTHQMFQEMSKSASDLSAQLQLKEKRKMEEMQSGKSGKLRVTHDDLFGKNLVNGLDNASFEKIQVLLDDKAP